MELEEEEGGSDVEGGCGREWWRDWWEREGRLASEQSLKKKKVEEKRGRERQYCSRVESGRGGSYSR